MSQFKLRDYQKEAVENFFNWLEQNEGNPLLVLPTGAGKSIIIAEIIYRLAQFNPRILVVTHVKELIAQNRSKLPSDIDAGIYSAGLGSKKFNNMVTFCGIQSVHSKANLFGKVDLVIIDEAHLLPPNGEAMYQKFLSSLLEVNPLIRIVGLTATPFRTQGVLMGEGNLFDDIAYEVPITKLIKDGYLCKLTTKLPEVQADMSGVKKVAGEYSIKEMSDRHIQITKEAIADLIKRGADRKSWLIFGGNIDHCYLIAEELKEHNISCGVVTGQSDDRDDTIKDFKAGNLRALVNFGVLTTGFDHPPVDLVALLRSTQSTGLYVQILGRGMRPAPDKENCLVVDYGGNIERHGPVDAIRIKETRSKGGKREYEVVNQPVQICPSCRSDCHVRVTSCPECGYEFPVKAIHDTKSSNAAILSEDVPIREVAVTTRIVARNRGKDGKPDTLRVTYYTIMGDKVTEWICLDHPMGFAKSKADAWAKSHFQDGFTPKSVEHATLNEHLLLPIKSISFRREGQFDRIYNYSFADDEGSLAGEGYDRAERGIASGGELSHLSDTDLKVLESMC